MKKIVNKLCIVTVIILLTGTVITSGFNSSGKMQGSALSNIRQSIDSSWVFTPNLASPQAGRSRHITGYTVGYRSNKLAVYLPYYGKADGGADVMSGKGPLDFTSSDFTEDRQQPKEGEWRITIKPKDYGEVRSMNFTIFDNGSASLDVTMSNRSPISFNGNVEFSK